MGLHKDSDKHLYTDFSLNEDREDLNHKKQVKRMLEDRLERKRLREEFKDDFDELSGEFDWDELDK